MIEELQADHLVYGAYGRTQTVRIDISDLIIPKENTGLQDPLNTCYPTPQDFKYLLLQRGLAELRTPETASQLYKDAQEQAKRERKGLWLGRLGPPAPVPDTESSPPEPLSAPMKNVQTPGLFARAWDALTNTFMRIWKWILSIGLAGVLLKLAFPLLRHIYRFFFVRRRVRLLIIGESSAGKSAICLRLLDEKASKYNILALSQTEVLKRVERKEALPYGRFEIQPWLSDTPGAYPSVIWNELLKRRLWSRPNAVLLALAPTDGKDTTNPVPDKSYTDIQLGYAQLIGGFLANNVTRKPRVVILFLNKFDLVSSHHPDDSASAAQKQAILTAFNRHIESVSRGAKRSKVKIETLVGSAVENWNCDRILPAIGKAMYGRE